MMIFITGGAYQGKTSFAQTLGLPVIDDLHLKIREWVETNADIEDEIKQLIAYRNCTIVCNEVGCGIIPVDRMERDYREMTGRMACYIAEKADAVYKVEAGLALRIKG